MDYGVHCRIVLHSDFRRRSGDLVYRNAFTENRLEERMIGGVISPFDAQDSLQCAFPLGKRPAGYIFYFLNNEGNCDVQFQFVKSENVVVDNKIHSLEIATLSRKRVEHGVAKDKQAS